MGVQEGKARALVTGASRGIGAAVAEALAAAGHPVVLNYRGNHDAAAAVRDRIVAAGGRAELAPFDVADAAAAEAALKAILAAGPVGVLVNNAGVTRDSLFVSMERAQWDDVVRTSLDGFYNVTRPLAMPMARARQGRIIAITSVAGITGNPGQVNYSAAKAGLIGATRALARELARRGVTVNAVAPGFIDTDMTKSLPVDQLLPMIPMRRLGLAAEVADLVAFLASEKAGYITGQCVAINGGIV